jgi:hypothetical protein
MMRIAFEVQIRAQSTSNLREHWAVKAKRVDAQKRATRAKCPAWNGGPLLVVTLTRVAPRRLDDDNLRGALKSVRDAVASWLRVDDASPLVRWEYGQEKGAGASVRVEVLGPAMQPPAVSPAWTGEVAAVENTLSPAPRKDVSGRRAKVTG